MSAQSLLDEVRFDASGLVPAIAQDAASGQVLMLAYMNEDALHHTLKTGRMTYWSRSRQQLWKKGETSGHVQHVKEVRLDCDGDTLLFKVDQVGDAACHTGHRSCFFRAYEDGALVDAGDIVFDPDEVYGDG
jgi:phosphoribosyl-AMP cyclohydrolase